MHSKKTKLVIIGGGTGGIMLSSRLMKTKAPVEVTLIGIIRHGPWLGQVLMILKRLQNQCQR